MRRVLSMGACALAISLSMGGHAAAQNYGADLPDPGIPGYSFPAKEADLLAAVDKAATADIYKHGWGLWTSLTASSGQTAYGIANAPVFLTWLTKDDLVKLSQQPADKKGALQALASGSGRTLGLGPASQLLKFGINSTVDEAPEAQKAGLLGATAVDRNTAVFETVAYNPAAAKHINDLGLFKLSTIQGMYQAGQIAEVPAFPTDSVSIKPVYKFLSKTGSDKRYFAMPAWPGTPNVTAEIVKDGFKEERWPGCIYVDVTNEGASGSSGIDGDCSRRTEEATYGLGDFIHFEVTADNLAAFTAEGYKVAEGDVLLLMAMHVTSREITEWTWQTYFWTPTPMNPPLPSSGEIAAAQPAQLKGPAAHYAMSIAYQMISPNQPVNGGNNVGKPMVAYNPYLESDFNKAVFSTFVPVTDPNTGVAWTGQVGVETNCMTCHSMAAVAFGSGTQTGYGTTFYIARDDKMFTDTVQTEFLWSIADVVNSQKPKKKK